MNAPAKITDAAVSGIRDGRTAAGRAAGVVLHVHDQAAVGADSAVDFAAVAGRRAELVVEEVLRIDWRDTTCWRLLHRCTAIWIVTRVCARCDVIRRAWVHACTP